MADGKLSTPELADQADSEIINVTLPREDYQRLSKLLATLEMVDGWCAINRIIAKYVIFAALAFVIWLSDFLDAVRNLLHLGKH